MAMDRGALIKRARIVERSGARDDATVEYESKDRKEGTELAPLTKATLGTLPRADLLYDRARRE
jgi:hypothetical protein